MRSSIFFITGRGRSGTWLLQSVLDSHNKICVAPESIFIEFLSNKYKNTKNWNKDTVTKFVRDLKKDAKLDKWWKIDFDALKEELLKEENLDYSKACLKVYESYYKLWNESEIHLLGDKNPEYALRIKSIIEKYPTSKFVILIRDPRDNISSYLNVDFDLNNPYALAARWNFYSNKILEASRQYTDQVKIVKFEDLVKEPSSTVESICDFLGIDYYPKLLEFYGSSKNIFKWNKKITQAFDANAAFKWKKDSNQRANQKISRFCASHMNQFGYEPSPEISLSVIDKLNYAKGYFVSYLEYWFYTLPVFFKYIILNSYRRKTKTF